MEYVLLNNTISLIENTFSSAEEQVKSEIKLYFSDATEEQITNIFQSKLGALLQQISRERKVALAFQKDIEQVITDKLTQGFLSYSIESYIKSISQGLVAEISWHKRHIEAKTGGDFGIVIIQPQIDFWGDEMQIQRCGEQRGLLVQAKLKKFNDKSFGQLTKSQKKQLIERVKYLSILRYKFLDNENKILDSFFWSVFDNDSMGDIMEWLKNDSFPTTIPTKDIINQLGVGKIGTSDKNIIRQIIEPQKTPTMIIKIDWKEDDSGYGIYNLNQEIINLLNEDKQQIYISLLKY